MNKTRAIVLQVPDQAPGVLFADGQQLQFTLQTHWRCATLPAQNMPVDAWLDGAGNLLYVEAAGAGPATADIGAQASGLIERMGRLPLGLSVALWFSWFFLPVVRISLVKLLGLPVIFSWTAWETLGMYRRPDSFEQLSNSMASSHGFGSMLALVALALPFVVPFWSDVRSKYLNAGPLAFLLGAYLKTQWDVAQAQRTAAELAAGNPWATKLAQELGGKISQAISLEFGSFVILLLCLALAVLPFVRRPAGGAVAVTAVSGR